MIKMLQQLPVAALTPMNVMLNSILFSLLYLVVHVPGINVLTLFVEKVSVQRWCGLQLSL